MVAIVSGNSLGLELTSLGTLGSQGLWGSAGQGNSGEQVYVNAATGNLVVQRRDDFLASRGLDNQAIRTYNSLGRLNDDNGDNWALGVYAQQLVLSGTVNTVGSSLMRTGRDGSVATYMWDATRSCYVTTDGDSAHDTITCSADEYLRTDGSSRAVEKYTATGQNGALRLVSLTDADGNLSKYSYTSAGLLSTVEDQTGEFTVYTYDQNGAGTKLLSITTKNAAGTATRSSVSYEYDGYGRLSTVKVDLTPDNLTDAIVYKTTYAYDGDSQRIKTLTQDDGTSLTFTYTADNRVETITDALGVQTKYTYDAGRTTITDALKRDWIYEYDYKVDGTGTGQLMRLTSPAVGGASIVQSYAYDGSGNVTSITNGDGETVTMAYDANGNQTKVTDHLGNTVTRTYSAATNRLLTESVSSLAPPAMVNQSGVTVVGGEMVKTGGVNNSWDSSTRSAIGYVSASVSFSAGQTNAHFMVGLNSDPDTSKSFTDLDWAFYCRNDGLLEIREGGTNVNKLGTAIAYAKTDMLQVLYDGQYVRYLKNGQELLKTQASLTQPLYVDSSFYSAGAKVNNLRFGDRFKDELTSRYVYSASKPNQLDYAISADGRVTKYQYDALGQRTSEIHYTVNRYDISALQAGAVPTEAQLDAWVTGLGGDLSGLSVRKDFDYDARGLLKTLKEYLNTNADGTGKDVRLTQYVYDPAGRLLQSIQAGGSSGDETGSPTTTYGYDGLGRVLTVTDPNGVWTSTVYTDSAQQVTVTYKSGAVTTSTYDKAGRLLSLARSGYNSTAYTYDAAGHMLMSAEVKVDGAPTGVRSIWLYDEVGRQVAVIDASGTLTETVYDRAGRVTRTRTYATAVTIASPFDPATGKPWTLGQLRPAALAADLQRWNVYNDAGQLVYEIGDDGAVTQHEYDGAGRQVRSVRYSMTIATVDSPTMDSVTALLDDAAVVAGKANDRVERLFYDADGLLTGTLDGEGYLTRYTYDAAGRRVQSLRYATAVVAGLRAGASLSALTPATDAQDQTTTFFYDARGLLEGEIDAEGYIIRNSYNTRGLLRNQTRYSTRVTSAFTWASDFDTVIKTIRSGGADALNANDRRSYWYYRQDGQLLKTVNYEGTETSYGYDPAGRLTQTTEGINLALQSQRISQVRVDASGRKTAELSAKGSARIAAGEDVELVWASDAVNYAYDASGRLIRVTDANDHTTLYFYDVDGRVTHTVNAMGEVEENQYNALGQRTATMRYFNRIGATDLAGLVALANGANSAVRALVVANASKDSKVSYGYDDAGRLLSVTDAEGVITTSHYNAFGQLSDQQVPWQSGVNENLDKRVDLYSYDRRGLLKQLVADSGTGNVAAKTLTDYDAFGRAVKVTDANGKSRTNAYDKLGRVLVTTDAETGQVTSTYDAFGQVLTVKDQLEQLTKYVYDKANRSVKMTTPEGVTVTTVHTEFGQTLTVTRSIDASNSVTTTYSYDVDGHLTQTQVGSTVVETQDYDAAGLLRFTKDANGVKTVYTYDAANRLFTRTLDDTGLKLTTTWDYDGKGQAWRVKDANDIYTEYSFDLNGRTLTQTVDTAELKLKTQYTYDAAGRVLTVTAPNNSVTQYTFDKLGRRKTEVVDFGTGKLNLTRSYTYDANGNVVSAVDAGGYTTRYCYDAEGRVTYTATECGVDANNNRICAVTYNEYDDRGQLTRRTRYANTVKLSDEPSTVAPSANDQVTRHTYDKDGRLTFTVDAMGGVTRLEYDDLGNVLRRAEYARILTASELPEVVFKDTLPNASTDRVTLYRYDEMGRRIWASNPLGGVTRTEYDKVGNVIRVTEFAKATTLGAEPSGVTADPANDRITVMTYDRANRVKFTIGGVFVDTDGQTKGYGSYNVYTDGQLTRVRRYANAITVSGNGPFAGAVTPDTANDRIDDYLYDGAGRVKWHKDAGLTEETFSYHATGQVFQHTRASNDAALKTTTEYLIDAAGRQTSKTTAAGIANLASTVQYRYDALGNLTAQIDPRGVALSRDNTEWAKAERVRLGFAELAPAPNSTQAKELLEKFTSYHTYDAGGRRISTTNALDQTSRTSYDAFGNAVKVVDPSGNAGYFYFDGLNRVTLQVDAEGYANEIAYANNFGSAVQSVWRRYTKVPVGTNETARPTITLNATYDARLQYNLYDKLGRLISSRNDPSDGASETVIYGVNGNRFSKSVTNKLGGTATYLYDKFGRQVQETLPVSVGGTAVVNTYEYNAFGDRIKSTEAVGLAEQRVTTYLYDKLSRQTHRIGQPYDLYDAINGQPLPPKKPVELIPAEWTIYDVLGRIIETRVSANAVKVNDTTYTVSGGARTLNYYDAAGNKVASVQPAGALADRVVDADGNKAASVQTSGTLTVWVVDPSGKVFKERVCANVVTTLPDSPGGTAPTVTADAANDRVTTSLYDAAGRLVETRRDAVIHWEQANNSNAITMDLPGSQPDTVTLQKLVYDANGNVLQEIDGRGNSVYSYYDKLGRKLLRIDQDGYATAWDYTDVFEAATKETKYGTRLPAYGLQNDTSVAANLRDPAALRAGLDDKSNRPVDGTNGVRVGYKKGNNSSLSRSLGTFNAGDTITFTIWFKADPQTMGQIFVGETRVYQSYKSAKAYGTGDWQQLTATVTMTSTDDLKIYMYGDRDGSFHRDGSFVLYDRAKVVSVQKGVVYEDSFETDLAGWSDSTGGLATLQAVSVPADRVTESSYYRTGRLKEQRIKSVVAEYVDSAGNNYTNFTDAVTAYTYNGLGLVTQVKERLFYKLDVGDFWNTTNITYDSLGREIKRQAPGYVDYLGNDVVPTSEIEYNGLGAVKREILRGTNDAVETDDRITSYEYNKNGERIKRTDANGNVMLFDFDAMGRMSRRTVMAVINADGVSTNHLKLYQYDAAGRNTVTTDVGTGEVRKTAYNAFGEISKKGLADGWQEFIEYNTLGKVQRSNTDGGVTSIFLYDVNGNATRKINSDGTKDLSLQSVSVIAAATDTTLLHTFSAYNKRNLLERTVEPDISFLHDQLSYQGAFSQQLADLYGPVSVGNSAGGTYTGGTINADTYQYTQVTTGSSAAMPTDVSPAVTGARSYGAAGTPPAGVNTGAYGFSSGAWGGYDGSPTHDRMPPTSKLFTMPSSWQIGTYRLRRLDTNTVLDTNTFPAQATFSVPTNVHGETRYNVEFYVGGTWVVASELSVSFYDADDWSLIWSSDAPSRIIVPNVAAGTTLFASTGAGTSSEVALSCTKLKDFNNTDVPNFWVVDTSSLAGGTQTISLRCMTANGHLAEGDNLTVSGTSVSAAAAIKPTDAWVSTKYKGLTRGVFFDGAKLGGTGTGTIWVRKSGTTDNWTSEAVSGWSVSLDGFAANVPYEFIVKTGTSSFHGTFTPDANGIPVLGSLGMLGADNTPATDTLTFDLTGHLSDETATSFQMELTLGGVKATKTITKDGNGKIIATFTLADFTGLAVDAWKNVSYDYSYLAYGVRSSIKQFVGQGAGKVQLGSDPKITTDLATTGFRPQAIIVLPSGETLSGNVTVRPQATPTDSISLSASDWRRKTVGTQVSLDLSQWFTWGMATKRFEVIYASGDANFTALYDLSSTGKVTPVPGGLTCMSREPKIPLTVAGATSLKVLKFGAAGVSESLMTAVDVDTRVATSGSTFTWNADNLDDGVAHRFYYEAVDAAGKLVGKGYGNFTLKADGSMTYTMETALLKPSEVRFTPPAQTTVFEITVKGNGVDETYTSGVDPEIRKEGSVYVFDASSLRPGSSSLTYALTYKGKDGGNLLSSGSGTLTVQSTGVTSSVTKEDRKPTIVTLYGPPGRNVPFMKLERRIPDADTDDDNDPWITPATMLKDDPNLGSNCSAFVWDASAITPETGTVQYEYRLTLMKSSIDAEDQYYLNEVGDPIITLGVMTLGGSTSNPVVMQQYVKQLNVEAQVRHMQSYNAFGQISEEYDDSTYERMKEMIELYGGTADMDAVHTTFKYNNAGLLISKTDPQTHVTAANGYRSRANPVTKYGYDLTGRLTTMTDANNNRSEQAFAGAGERLSQQWAGDGAMKKTEYDVFGDMRKATDELGAVVNYTYDQLGNMTKAEHVGINRVENFTGLDAVASTLTDTYVYDALGQRIKHTNVRGWDDKTFYDSLGRVVKTVSATLDVTQYTYVFVAAGTSGGILGAGGKNVGGYKLTTTQEDGRMLIDSIDYFGRTTWHQDLAGYKYTYNYDWGGRLGSQTSNRGLGQNIQYKYYANGYIREAKDLTEKTLSLYGYDNAGNRISESYSRLSGDNNSPVGFFQASTIAYDELNRMSHISDVSYDLRYEYDAVGNRRAALATYFDPLTNGLRKQDEMWYAYDKANRFTLTMGQLHGGKRGISTGDTTAYLERGADGVTIEYDLAGRRKSAIYGSATGDKPKEEYFYTTEGYLEDVKIGGVLRARRRVDALGRTLSYYEWSDTNVKSTTTTAYNHDNRLESQTTKDGTTVYNYYTNTSDTTANALGRGELANTVFTPTSGSTTTTTTYTYQYWDSAKQVTIKKKASDKNVDDWAPGFSYLSYDTNGYLKTATDTAGGRTNSYISNATGLTLQRNETKAGKTYSHFWYYAAGRRVGDVSTDPTDNARISYAESLALSIKEGKVNNDKFKNFKPVTSADFDQNYEPINATYPAGSPDTYTVRTGDTLQTIALNLWGDSAMWYLLAQANNLQGKEILVQGQVLIVPNKVTNIHNNANTFRPYNPGEVIGNVDPTLPAPTAKDNCGAFSLVVQVIVTIVVSIYTGGNVVAGAAAGNMAGQYVRAGAAGKLDYWDMARGGGSRTTELGLIHPALLADPSGGYLSRNAWDHYLSHPPGFRGENKYDYKSTAAAAAAAYVASYVGGGGTGTESAAGTTAGTTEAVAASQASSIPAWVSQAGQAAAAGAASSAASQLIQGKWSWREVAASAVGGAFGSMVGQGASQVVDSKYVAQLASSMAGGWASGQVNPNDPRSASARMGGLFISSLGNALGSSIADGMQQAPNQSDAETARLNRYEGAALEQEAANNRTVLNTFNRENDAYYSAPSYESWPDETGAEKARLNRNEAKLRFLDGAKWLWEAEDAASSNAFLKQQNANADAYHRQLARERFDFSDGLDTRDIRLGSFSYKSRLSIELAKADAISANASQTGNSPQARSWDGNPGTPPASQDLEHDRPYVIVRSLVNMVGSGAGLITSGAITTVGVGLIGAPEPTLLSKPAGVAVAAFGAATFAKNAGDFSVNAANLWKAATETGNYYQDSILEQVTAMATEGSIHSAYAVRSAAAGNLALDLAAGKVPSKWVVSTGAKFVPGQSAALFQAPVLASVESQALVKYGDTYYVADRIGNATASRLGGLAFDVNENIANPFEYLYVPSEPKPASN